MAKFIDGSPPPSAHLATLMRVGYSFTSAVGDILDNSIAAGATQVGLELLSVGDNYKMVIRDDGTGMTADELVSNMIIGCKDPSESRLESDLGRFGSGLKTASFSQAQLMTVLTWKEQNDPAAACWDTEAVRRKNEWCLQQFSAKEAETKLQHIGGRITVSGTVVCWENMTEFKQAEDADARQIIAGALISELHNYIGLHFHRFLARGLRININGRKVTVIDPFMRGEIGYEEGPSQKLRGKNGTIIIQAHTLPRPSTLSAKAIKLHGGSKAITSNQGLYLYRNKRLISAGGWHGVARSSELNNLARIQIDISSNMDDEWQTDVKKSQLSIPRRVKGLLSRITPSPIRKSKRSHKYAGKKQAMSDYWLVQTNEREGEEAITYIPNTGHEDIALVLSELPDSKRESLINYLQRLSQELPVQHIYNAFASNPRNIQLKEDVEARLVALLDQIKKDVEQ